MKSTKELGSAYNIEVTALWSQIKDKTHLKYDLRWFNSFLCSLLTNDYYHAVRWVEMFWSLRI